MFKGTLRRILPYFCFAVLAALLVWGAFLLDKPLRQWVEANDTKASRNMMGRVSHFGDWPYLMAVTVPLALLCAKLRKVRAMDILIMMIVASTLSGVLANCSRLTTGRTRPSAKMEQGWYGLWHEGKLTIGRAKMNSFPSGHTATAVGLATPLVLLVPAAGVPLMVGALLVAASRIYVGAHHLSDVVVSTLLALVVGWLVVRFWPKSFGKGRA